MSRCRALLLRAAPLALVGCSSSGSTSLPPGVGASQAPGDTCPGFVEAYNLAGNHVKAGLAGGGGLLLENSLRHDGDAARAAAASVSGSAKADLTRLGQALDQFRAATLTARGSGAAQRWDCFRGRQGPGG